MATEKRKRNRMSRRAKGDKKEVGKTHKKRDRNKAESVSVCHA